MDTINQWGNFNLELCCIVIERRWYSGLNYDHQKVLFVLIWFWILKIDVPNSTLLAFQSEDQEMSYIVSRNDAEQK